MADLYDTIHRIKSACKKSKSDGKGGYTACCPAHDDGEPSLSFRQKGDRIVMHCHAGCDPDNVRRALGLEWSDLFADDARDWQKKARPERPLPGPLVRRPAPEPPVIDWHGLHLFLLDLPSRPDRLAELAADLGVTPESLEKVGWVWVPRFDGLDDWLKEDCRNWTACWACPERDESGAVIGLNRRYEDGAKKQIKGGRRGLIYDPSLPAIGRAVLVVEGATDTCTGIGLGVTTIGRPNNTGGGKLASLLLAMIPFGTPVIVLGENDRKENGRWPGKEGAENVAQELADAMPSHEVYVAYPPDGAKDLRAWAAGRGGAEVGDELLDRLEITRVRPSPRRSREIIEEKTCAGMVAVPAVAESEMAAMLPGLPSSPPPWMCRRGGGAILRDEENAQHYRAVRHACDCWHCSTCRTRLAVRWAEHVACCVLLALRAEQPRTLYLHENVAGGRKEWARLRDRMNHHGTHWAALETAHSRFLVVAAWLPGQPVPDGAVAISIEDLGQRLVEWARTVRTWPEPFSRKQTRPVRTSKHWRLPEQDFGGRWKYVAPVAALKLDTLLEALSKCGIRPTRVEDAIFAACNPLLGKSCVWCVEWITSPEPECVGAMLRALTEAADPLPVGVQQETEPIPD